MQLLFVYDDTKRPEIIIAVIELYEYLNELQKSDILFLNSMQAYKRVRKLNDIELKTLIEMRDTSESTEIKCGCCILLDSVEEFKYHFNKLSREQQKSFVQYPIVKLLPSNILN